MPENSDKPVYGSVGLADLSLTSQKLAEGAVVTQKIRDKNVTGSKLADGAVSTDKLADGAISTDKIADGAVTASEIADGAIDNAKLASNIVLPGTPSAGATGHYLLASNSTTESACSFIRGEFNGLASIIAGSGFTVSRTAQGQYTITWGTSFATTPTAVFTTVGSSNLFGVQITSIGTSNCSINVKDLSGFLQDSTVCFIVIGPRNF